MLGGWRCREFEQEARVEGAEQAAAVDAVGGVAFVEDDQWPDHAQRIAEALDHTTRFARAAEVVAFEVWYRLH